MREHTLCLFRHVGAYLRAVKRRLTALHVLDRFHIRQLLNKAVD